MLSPYPGVIAGTSPGAVGSIPPLATMGKIFYVGSSQPLANDNNLGDDPNHPRATVAATIAKCRPNKGDIIWCLRGHTETISIAAGIDVNVAGVSVICEGYGDDRPTFTFSGATTATWLIEAASFRLANA